MDEKTAELRDIFREVADTETVTERQSDDRGSLADEGDLREAIRDVLADLDADEGIDVGLSQAELVDVVLGFYDGADDEAIAADLDADAATVRRARLECHLLREGDVDGPVDVDRLRSLREEGATPATCAEQLDADRETVEWLFEALEAREATIRTGRRYPDAFESAVAEAGLVDRLTADAKRDGLEEATADAEVDTDF